MLPKEKGQYLYKSIWIYAESNYICTIYSVCVHQNQYGASSIYERERSVYTLLLMVVVCTAYSLLLLELEVWAGPFGLAQARYEKCSPKYDTARSQMGRAGTVRMPGRAGLDN